MSKLIVEMTPFIFEDGNTYYFQIFDRDSQVYHDLYLYKDFEVEKKTWFGLGKPKIVKERIQMYEQPISVDVELKVNNIKIQIKRELIRRKATYVLSGWDGIVGDITEATAKSLKRDDAIGKILN